MPYLFMLRGMAQIAIENDASEEQKKELRRGYERLLSAFGFNAPSDIDNKVDSLRRFLPELKAAAERIIQSREGIERS